MRIPIVGTINFANSNSVKPSSSRNRVSSGLSHIRPKASLTKSIILGLGLAGGMTGCDLAVATDDSTNPAAIASGNKMDTTVASKTATSTVDSTPYLTAQQTTENLKSMYIRPGVPCSTTVEAVPQPSTGIGPKPKAASRTATTTVDSTAGKYYAGMTYYTGGATNVDSVIGIDAQGRYKILNKSYYGKNSATSSLIISQLGDSGIKTTGGEIGTYINAIKNDSGASTKKYDSTGSIIDWGIEVPHHDTIMNCDTTTGKCQADAIKVKYFFTNKAPKIISDAAGAPKQDGKVLLDKLALKAAKYSKTAFHAFV